MSKPPIIAVVGSTNAGKSTLINRLSGTRTTVVHETPGVTRDRKEVEAEWCGRRLVLVDTGGFNTGDQSQMGSDVRSQVGNAIDGADLILFILDGRAGPLADDFEIAEVVRRAKAPCVVIANKLDDPSRQEIAPEIYALGLGDPVPLSAAHGLGTGDLLDQIFDMLPADSGRDVVVAEEREGEIPVVIVGRPNAGKSSLFNALVGEPRTIVSEIAGTTRDAIDTTLETVHGSFRFVDTAGMRKAAKVSGIEYYSYLRSLQGLDRAHVAVIVVDGTIGLSELDIIAAAEAMKRGCATLIAVNKCDIADPDLEEIGGIVRRKLRQRPEVVPVSAVSRRGVKDLFVRIADLDRRFRAHLGTRELNRALADIVAQRTVPGKGARRLKMYYIAQFQTSPPRIAIEVNDRTLITRDYGFFVENRLRAHFGLEGVPLIIDFKGK